MAKTWSTSPLPAPVFSAHHSIASNGDGTKLLACEYGGKIYQSIDSGVSWGTLTVGVLGDLNWWSIDSDLDGSNLIVAAFNQAIYTSVDSGANWSDVTPVAAVGNNWTTVASDDDGSFLVAFENDNLELYVSGNAGATWSLSPLTINVSWGGPIGIGVDSDGSTVVVGDGNGGVNVSTDSGVSWTERSPGGIVDGEWNVDVSSDGSRIVACDWNNEVVYVSSDSGANWSDVTPVVGESWIRATSNAGGNLLTVSADGGRMYYSDDYGATWTETRPAGDTDQDWKLLVSGKTTNTLFTYIPGGTAYVAVGDGIVPFLPPADIVTNKRLIAFSNNTLYYEDI